MTDVAHLDPLPFRARILQSEFYAIHIGEVVWTQVMPDFVAMYPLGQLYMMGKVVDIIENTTRDTIDRRIVVVANELGQWSFRQDGLSLNKICKLAVNRVYGQLLWLYEPEFIERLPPTERGFEKEPIEQKTTRRELA